MPVANTVKRGINLGVGAFFSYETQKIVQINSFSIGIINRFIQLCIIAYIIGYVLVYKKGYQLKDEAISGVITKVKGVSYVNNTNLPDEYRGAWDVQDIVVPPMENDAFFVTTNLIITRNQTNGQCPEDPSVPNANCTSDSDCPAGYGLLLGHGTFTGRCVNATDPTKGNVCQVHAWCPIENDVLPGPLKKAPLFNNIPDYTVLIKNSIEFQKFDVKRRNILESYSDQQLQNCSDTRIYDPLCPVLRLDTIFEHAGVDYQKIGIEGAVIAIEINWDCNLDFSPEDCNPVYKFRRIDSPTTKIARGWNYRYDIKYYENGVLHRDLYKAYGVRFLIKVTGKAGKFNIVPFTTEVGSGLALLGLATLLCDMIVLYCMSRRDKYRYAKYQNIKDDDALQGLLASDSVQNQYGAVDTLSPQEINDIPEVTVHQ